MQMYLSFYAPEGLSIPVNYNHYLQSLIYRALEDGSDYSGLLHDRGWEGYRLFTFGRLTGDHRITGRTLFFSGDVNWEVRSASGELCERLIRGLESGPELCLVGSRLELRGIKTESRAFASPEVRVRTLTPVVVCTNQRDGRTVYYSPDDEHFTVGLEENFLRKYAAFHGGPPPEGIRVEVLETGKKQVTKYGNRTWVNGWHCRLKLKGCPENLEFLYNVGLGRKNAQGFGMFKVEE